MHNVTNGLGYTQDNKRWRSSRTVRFTVKYSFGNMKAKRKPGQSDGGEIQDGSGYGEEM